MIRGDARELARVLREAGAPDRPFVDLTITSPPYGALKDYGERAQIGFGQHHEAYLSDCQQVFREVADVSRRNASLWVIVDTIRRRTGAGSSTLEMLQHQLVAQAEKAGWLLQDVVIWQKDRTLPWSARGRLRNSFEYVLHLVRGPDFVYHLDRLRSNEDLKQWWVRFPERYNPLGKAPTNVWEIPIPRQGAWRPSTPAHFCPLPLELVDRIVQLSSNPGQVVLDPFAGTGAVLKGAAARGRSAVGVELQSRYVGQFNATSESLADSTVEMVSAGPSPATIWHLRALKRGRDLGRVALDYLRDDNARAAVIVIGGRRSAALAGVKRYEVQTLIVVDIPSADADNLRSVLWGHATTAPLSKFGVDGAVEVVRPSQVAALISRRRLHRYRPKRFWSSAGLQPVEAVIRAAFNDDHWSADEMPLLSDLFVDERLGR